MGSLGMTRYCLAGVGVMIDPTCREDKEGIFRGEGGWFRGQGLDTSKARDMCDQYEGEEGGEVVSQSWLSH